MTLFLEIFQKTGAIINTKQKVAMEMKLSTAAGTIPPFQLFYSFFSKQALHNSPNSSAFQFANQLVREEAGEEENKSGFKNEETQRVQKFISVEKSGSHK